MVQPVVGKTYQTKNGTLGKFLKKKSFTPPGKEEISTYDFEKVKGMSEKQLEGVMLTEMPENGGRRKTRVKKPKKSKTKSTRRR
jgi:hypothetical protein